MSLLDRMPADIRRMTNDLPVSFIHQGTTYIGMEDGLIRTKRLEIGGFDQLPDKILVVPLKREDGSATFSTEPAEQETITIDAQLYRITRIVRCPGGSSLQMDLGSVDR